MSRRPCAGARFSGCDLLRMDLIAVDSSADGLRHYVDDRHHAEVLATADPSALRALCGCAVVPESLCVEPGPTCSLCQLTAQRDLDAGSVAIAARRPAWPWRSRRRA